MARVGWNDLSGLGKGSIYANIGGGLPVSYTHLRAPRD